MSYVRVSWWVALVMLAAAPLAAQFDTAEVLGTIRDSSGSLVGKTSVLLANQNTGSEVRVIADDNGNYTFSNVKIGTYTVTAEAVGFSKAVATNIIVDVNARQRVDLTLQVGAVSESVEVSGAASALQTDSSDRGQLINTAQVVELP